MHWLRIITLLAFSMCISACNNLTTKPVQESGDLKDIATTQQRAKLAYDAGNWANAETHYLKLTRQIPGDAEPWFRLGNVYTHLSRPDDAIKAYQESIVRNPKNTKTWHNLGIVQLREATNTFVQLQQYSNPDDPLGERARYVVNAVSQIMEQGFGVTDEETGE